jgi:cytochrome c biogenesis protein CcdA
MTAFDILVGFVAGVVSCLTPESLLLFPLMVGAVGVAARPGIVAIAVGLGLALVLTGAFAGSFGMLFGLDAIWSRRFICVLLILLGFVLMSGSLVARFPRLTGGEASLDGARPGMFSGATFRMLLLAMFVGANWIPVPGPTLVRASLMAADARDPALAFGTLFAFGLGAALPWIALGRIIAFFLRPTMPGLANGMAGKRILGLTLLIVAVVGMSGQDVPAAQWLNGRLPHWARKLATTF